MKFSSLKSAHHSSTTRLSALVFAISFLHPIICEAWGASSIQVRRDGGGRVRALFNIGSRAYPGTPEEAARSYLREQSPLSKVEGASTRLVTDAVSRVAGGTHVRFIQEFAGIPLYRGDVVVSINERNEVGMVVSNARPDVDLPSVTPALSADRALTLSRALLDARGKALYRSERSELIVYPLPAGGYVLAYRITMALEDPAGDWEIILDAATGKELRREDRFVRSHPGERSVSGSGAVYLLNPLSAARRNYGEAGFLNNGNAESDSLNRYRAIVPLDSLTTENGLYVLAGPACAVTEIESPADPGTYTATSPDGFRFTRGEPGFEAVMAYYHITTAYRRFTDLGFDLPGLRTLAVDPHGFQGKDNSHYSPSGNWISFGTGGVEDAEDAEVIWHEYAHAIHYNIVPFWGGGETAALGEGYGDYWAASYARSLNQWKKADPQYQWIFGWDGHNPYWPGRILNDPRTYPFPSGSVHAAGQIWASTLLSIQSDLGRDVTDRLVMKGIYYLGSEATAVDAANSLLQADRDLYGGAHLPTLVYWLGTVKHFLALPDRIPILVIGDEAGETAGSSSVGGSGGSSTIRQSTASFLPSLPLLDAFGVQRATFASLDTGSLRGVDVVVLTSGTNPRPFADQVKRRALIDFVNRGGKILVEGGEVGSAYRPGLWGQEADRDFRCAVLHLGGYSGDAIDRDVSSDPISVGIFAQPHRLPSLLSFHTPASPADRDMVQPLGGERSTVSLGRWQDDNNGVMIAHHRTDGSVGTLYLPFAVSALADTLVARDVMENALSYLLYHTGSTSAVGGEETDTPSDFVLHQNYPNPFNPVTRIAFDLTAPARVKLEIFDLLGRSVASLMDAQVASGHYETEWNGRNFDGRPAASGTYLFRLQVDAADGRSGNQIRTMKLIR